MRKGFSILLIIMSILLFVSGCSSSKVADDLVNYINNELQPLTDLEDEAIDTWLSVSGDNYESDDVMYYALTDVIIPAYSDFQNKLIAIKPQTEEVRKVHDLFVQAASDQMNGFFQLQSALIKDDADQIDKAYALLEKGGNGINEWNTALLELMDQHKVEFEE